VSGDAGASRQPDRTWLRVREHGVEIRVRVVPRSSGDRVDGTYGELLRVRLSAPPVGQAANQSLIRLVARAARVAPSRVRIVVGERSRSKLVFVDDDVDPQATAARIVAAFGA
jgi:uncharacterized protein (TIGR00251 family)